MRATVDNHRVRIEDPSPRVIALFREKLSYTDKSKQYQLMKMGKNPFLKKSNAYKALKQEVYGSLLVENDDGSIEFPAGFVHLIKDIDIVDNRKLTGKNVAYPWKKKPFDPRDYQEDGISLMENNYRGLINFATGLGKTLTAVHAIRRIGKRALVLCPSTSIADNFYEELCSAFGENKVGYFGDGKKKIKDVTVGIAGSVNNHIEKFKEADLGLIIIDEVHHVPANTFFSIANQLGSVGKMFGLTATDFRADGKDVLITAGVGEVLIKRDLIWGIKNGWLADPYIVMREVDTDGKNFKDDKLKNYKAHVLNSAEMNSRIISDCKKFIDAGMSVLCLVDEVSHGKTISEALGVPFATGIDKQSSKYVEQLNKGDIPGLVGTDSKIGEGTDTKRVDVLVLANFVANKGALWQNLGRGMRLYGDKKQVIVLDYKPLGSDMLSRHADQRLAFYKEITSNIKVC
jgi:superfamily II DNA or RNA helicase